MSKQQIIIFEGHDKCGKTTIAKELSKQLKIPYFRNEMTNAYFKQKINFLLAMYYDQEYIIQFLEQTKYSIIFDRAYPSNYVYSKIYNRPMDFEFLDYLDRRFSMLGAKIIICEKDIKVEDFEDEFIAFEDIQKIKERYVSFTGFTECKTLRINTTDENLRFQIETIFGWFDE